MGVFDFLKGERSSQDKNKTPVQPVTVNDPPKWRFTHNSDLAARFPELAREEKMARHQLYKQLVSLVWAKGEQFPKKHGCWIRVWLDQPQGLFINMDAYNSCLEIRQGSGLYDPDSDHSYYLGCEGRTLENLGSDWGGFTPRATPERLEELVTQLTTLPDRKEVLR
jgi:hypothetical protein